VRTRRESLLVLRVRVIKIIPAFRLGNDSILTFVIEKYIPREIVTDERTFKLKAYIEVRKEFVLK